MKEIRSHASISVEKQDDSYGIFIQHMDADGTKRSTSFTPYSTREDALRALSFGRSVLRDGYSDLWAGRKVIALERKRV